MGCNTLLICFWVSENEVHSPNSTSLMGKIMINTWMQERPIFQTNPYAQRSDKFQGCVIYYHQWATSLESETVDLPSCTSAHFTTSWASRTSCVCVCVFNMFRSFLPLDHQFCAGSTVLRNAMTPMYDNNSPNSGMVFLQDTFLVKQGDVLWF